MANSRLSIIFFGSPDFAVPCLEAVAGRHNVLTVVTQPDRPRGRGRALAPPPVKVAAEKLGLPVFQPEKLRRKAVRLRLTDLGADYFVVVAYGHILSARMLGVPKQGCVNVHASLLPRLRGAAPIHWAVVRGEQRSGVTTMLMDPGMDTGPMLLRRPIDLTPDETAGSLHDKLAPLGAQLLVETLAGLAEGSITPTEQDHDRATVAPMLSKADGQVDFARPAAEVDCQIRGLDPWPGAYTQVLGKRLKLFRSSVEPGSSGQPGQVVGADHRGLLVCCGQGAVRVAELQLAGRKRMAAEALLSGHPIPGGTVLGTDGQAVGR